MCYNTAKNTEQTTEFPNLCTVQGRRTLILILLVWLSANDKKVKINTILDNASTVSYVYVNQEVELSVCLRHTRKFQLVSSQ